MHIITIVVAQIQCQIVKNSIYLFSEHASYFCFMFKVVLIISSNS